MENHMVRVLLDTIELVLSGRADKKTVDGKKFYAQVYHLDKHTPCRVDFHPQGAAGRHAEKKVK